jgi:hypothetical protein
MAGALVLGCGGHPPSPHQSGWTHNPLDRKVGNMAGMNPMVDRRTWLTILESASQKPGDEIDDEWRWLLQQLRMSADDYFALREALRQGRWRDAKNPRAYIKTVARREVNKES